MAKKPTYKELEQRIKKLEKESTELRRSEEIIRSERDKLHSLTDGLACAEIGIDIVGIDYAILFQSQFLKERFGDFTGQLCYEKYMGLEEPCDFCPMIKAVRNNKVESVELTAYDGRNYELLSAPLSNPDGTVDKVIEVVRDITEQKQAEEKLRESEELLRATIESTADGILVVNNKGQVICTNERFAQLWQIPEELIKNREDKTLLDFVLDQLKEPKAFLSKVQALYKSSDDDLDVLNFKDGRVLERFSSPLIRDGQIAGRVWSFRDITDAKRAEEALRESEERHRLLLEVSPDPIVVYNIEGKTIYVNPAFEQTFGWSLDELREKRIDFVPEENWPETKEAINRMLQGLKIQLFETRRLTKDGRILDIQLSSSLFFYRDEKPAGNIVILRDITVLKRAEETLQKAHDELEQRVKKRTAELVLINENLKQEIVGRQHAEALLHESKEHYRTLAENSLVGFWQITLEGYTTYINPAMCSMIEIESPAELSGQTYHSFFTSESLEIIDHERTKRPEGRGSCYEAEIIGKNGGRRNVMICGGPLLFTKGKLHGYIATFTDITDLKKAEEKLREAHDELERRVKKRTRELEVKKGSLEEINTAMKVLLKKRKEDKIEIEDNVLTNVKELIEPYFEKIKKTKLDDQQEALLSIIESNINEIVSPFTRKMSLKYLNLTPTEIRIANLIRHGSTTKEIAEILHVSPKTVETHRKNIRRKIGLDRKRANLRSHLLSLH